MVNCHKSCFHTSHQLKTASRRPTAERRRTKSNRQYLQTRLNNYYWWLFLRKLKRNIWLIMPFKWRGQAEVIAVRVRHLEEYKRRRGSGTRRWRWRCGVYTVQCMYGCVCLCKHKKNTQDWFAGNDEKKKFQKVTRKHDRK